MSTQYGNASWMQKLRMVASLCFHMPLVLAWTLLISPFHPNNVYKSWKRVVMDKLSYFCTEEFDTVALQWLLGDTNDTYMKWTKQNGFPALTEDLGGGAKLYWVGKMRTDRVLLYFHGGLFYFPLTTFGIGFWIHTLDELKKREVDAGLAILNYSLMPAARFPTPLKQAALALGHLISIGVSPENIQITGDSAGANLALQLISHILHPLDGVQCIKLSAPISGVYLMSPWLSLSGHGGSFIFNNDNDIISGRTLAWKGRQILDKIPDSQQCYIDASKAPKSWFKDVRSVVDRVLITAGDAECLRDEIVVFADLFCRNHDCTHLIMEKHGVHADPLFNFIVNGRNGKAGETSLAIWDWLAAGFKVL